MFSKSYHRWRRLIARGIRQRPLTPFLLAATVALNLMLVTKGGDLDDDFGLTTMVAQLGLLAIWAGQLRRYWAVRLFLAAIGVVALAFVWALGVQHALSEILTVFACYTLAVTGLNALCRLIGRLLTKRSDGHRHKFRFSIGGVLALTTTTAIAATLWRYRDLPKGETVELLLGFGSWALLPLLAWGVVRTARGLGLSILGVGAVGLLSAFSFSMLIRGADGQEFFLLTFWQAFLIGLWLIGSRERASLASHRVPQDDREESSHDESVGQASIDLEA